MGVEIIVESNAWKLQQSWSEVWWPLCKKKRLNKAGFFRLEKKEQKMDKVCLQEARREAIEANCSLFIFMQVQGHIKLSSQEVPNRRRGIASCRCAIKSRKSSGQGVMNSKTLH